MRANEAISLAQKSMKEFKAQLDSIEIQSHIALVKDLGHANAPEVFKEAKNSLKQKLSKLYDGVKDVEKGSTKPEAIDVLRHHVHEKTGIWVDDNTSPSKAVKKLMDEVASL